jgi:hypothetical protein
MPVAKDEKGYRVEYVALSELQRWPRNPKTHDEKGLDESLARFGFTEPLVLDETSGKLVAGHGRMEALQRWQTEGKQPPKNIAVKGKEWLVPVVRGIGFNNVQEAEAYLLASNRLTEIGGWDNDSLAEMLSSLQGADLLKGTGYQPADVEAVFREIQANAPIAQPGPTPAELESKFLAAEIKQVVLYFEGKEYDAVVNRLESVQKAENVVNNTDAVLKLLAFWEAQHAPVPAAG